MTNHMFYKWIAHVLVQHNKHVSVDCAIQTMVANENRGSLDPCYVPIDPT